jgi:hypothetical protein
MQRPGHHCRPAANSLSTANSLFHRIRRPPVVSAAPLPSGRQSLTDRRSAIRPSSAADRTVIGVRSSSPSAGWDRSIRPGRSSRLDESHFLVPLSARMLPAALALRRKLAGGRTESQDRMDQAAMLRLNG